MKKLIFSTLLIPFCGFADVANLHASTTNLVEVRAGDLPMNLERNIDRRDTSYALLFRDQQVINSVLLDTLTFSNLQQLKYFQQALTALKSGHHGDIAEFKDYSIKRSDVKYQGIWYLLRIKWGLTNFQQPEADIMIKTIQPL